MEELPVEESPVEASYPAATYFSSAIASSELSAEGEYSYSADNLLKKDKTCWAEGHEGAGENEIIKLYLPDTRMLSGLEIINGYALGTEKQYNDNGKVEDISVSFSDGQTMYFTLDEMSTKNRGKSQYIRFDEPVATDYVTITILSAYDDKRFDDTCLTYIAPIQ